MKRILSIILSFLITVCSIFPALASEADQIQTRLKASGYYKDVYDGYQYHMSGYMWNEYFNNDNSFAYVLFSNQVKNKHNPFFDAAMSAATNLINGLPVYDMILNARFDPDDAKVEYYEMALSSLLVTLEQDINDSINHQVDADLTMSGWDYVMKENSAAAGTISVFSDGVLPYVADYIGALTDEAKKQIDSYEDLQILLRDQKKYNQFTELLRLIQKNTDDPLLKKAAENVRHAIDFSNEYKIKQINEDIANTMGYLSTPFFHVFDMVEKDLKKSLENGISFLDGTDEFIEKGGLYAVKFLNTANQLYGAAKTGTDIGIFISDVLVGGSNIVLRYYEMLAMAEVREALLVEIQKEHQKITSPDQFEEIKKNCDLLRTLACVNIRGDHCMYSLLTMDANFLTLLVIKDDQGQPIDYDDWHQKSVNIARANALLIDGIVLDTEDYIDLTVKPSQDKVARRNYYNYDGLLTFYESYAYYDNGALCSTTLHSMHYSSSGTSYIDTEYTLLYLYDENGNLADTVLDAFTIGDRYNKNTDEVVLDYGENGEDRRVSIYPKIENIEQEKFGVDSSKTEEVYDGVPIITTDSSGGWAAAYLNEIFQDEDMTGMASCRLIYIDDNPTPELWIDYGFDRTEIYTQSNNGTDHISISNGGIEWIENENLLLVSRGHMDSYYDEIYKIEDGKFSLIGTGDYGAVNNSDVQFDEQGNPIYHYYWNDVALTKDEYEQSLSNIFDRTKSADIDRNIYTYDQCRLLLQSLTSDRVVSAPEESVAEPKMSVPSDAEAFGGHHYKIFTIDDVTTWEAAKAYCESLDGHLAIITSSEENIFLYQLMVNGGYANAYFGLTDSYDEGNWIWMDGFEPVYLNWHSGEPNSENANEDYAMFYWKYKDGTWNDGDFGKRTNKGGTTFICEWNY